MKNRVNIVFVTIFALAVIALFVFVGARGTQRVQSAFLSMIAPFLRQGSAVERKYTTFREGLKSLEQLEEENKRLKVRNQELSATNQTLRDLEAENNRLRNALGYLERTTFQLMPARIIARDAATWYNTIRIDRGSAEFIEPDMPVLTESGLVGKTTKAIAEHAGTVILISDENCKVAATVEGTREQGIVKGERTSHTGMPVVSLNFLSKQANLQPGQAVYTSGIGGVFPSGILIGHVKEYKVRELDGYATLVPAVDLSTIRDVFVIVANSK